MRKPELVQYTVEVETRVVVVGNGRAVGEYTVRHGSDKQWSDHPKGISGLVEVAMVKNTKQATIMAAGVENTERNRLK